MLIFLLIFMNTLIRAISITGIWKWMVKSTIHQMAGTETRYFKWFGNFPFKGEIIAQFHSISLV